MADNSAKAVKMTRNLAIAYLIVGFLLFCFGIADRAIGNFWTGYVCFGVWAGAWMFITAAFGIHWTRKEQSTSRNVCAAVYMGFSITSAVLGGIIIICYSISILMYRVLYIEFQYYDIEMAISSIILVLGIVELVIGIFAAVRISATTPICYNTPLQQGQVTYTANPAFVLTQIPCGTPVAIPIQGGGMNAAEIVTPVAQRAIPQIVMVPVSGAEVCQPQLDRVAAAEALSIDYQPLQVDLPPLYHDGGMVTVSRMEGHQPQLDRLAADEALSIDYQPMQVDLPPLYQDGGMVTVSRTEGHQPRLDRVAQAEAMHTDYQTLQVDLPPPYEE